jgi:predicted AAA+ superfamily ATPase
MSAKETNMAEYIHRAIEDTVLRMSSQFRIVLLTGPRQCGKTTVLKALAGQQRSYVTLDDLNERELAKSDPALFVETHQPPVLIDEIQYAPEILPYIKMKVDEDDARGAYWLTGSQVFSAMRDVTESLAGRVGVVRMLGLSRSELRGCRSVPFDTSHERLLARVEEVPAENVNSIFALIHRGSMPELYAYPAIAPADYYSSYLSTYIERDIRSLVQVVDEMAFLRFMTAAAARTSQPVIMEDIAREVGIDAKTVRRWLSLLVASGIVALLPAYDKDVLKRAVKMPKLHFLDTGLAAHILKWNNPQTLEAGALSGPLFESWVFSEIYKSYLNDGKEPPLSYYRDKQKHEIDVLIQQDDCVLPVEIKKTASPGRNSVVTFRQLSPLELLSDRHRVTVGEGTVLCMINHPLPESSSNWYIPAWLV